MIQGASSPGTVDFAFNPALNQFAFVYAITVQTNGKILIGGSFSSVGATGITNLARLNADGSLDGTFNPGAAADSGYVSAIALQPDGKIVVGGSFGSSSGAAPANLARLNSDGTVDTDFDATLYVDSAVNAIVVQSDGKILFGGAFLVVDGLQRRNVARLNADGTLDMTFDACVASSAGSGATALAVQPDGKILASGNFVFSVGAYRYGIARLGVCGDLDQTYAAEQPGIAFGSVAYTLALRSDGRVVLAGDFRSYQNTTRGGIVQLTTNGTVDVSFNPGTGIDFDGTIYHAAIQTDGKVMIGGDFLRYNDLRKKGIARLNRDGSLDNVWDLGSGPDAAVGFVAFQSDGKALVGGKFSSVSNIPRNGIARLAGDPKPFSLSLPSRSRTTGLWQMTLFGESQVHYGVQASSNLVDWISITNFTAAGTSTRITDFAAGPFPSRLYRALFIR